MSEPEKKIAAAWELINHPDTELAGLIALRLAKLELIEYRTKMGELRK